MTIDSSKKQLQVRQQVKAATSALLAHYAMLALEHPIAMQHLVSMSGVDIIDVGAVELKGG